jgi:heat shock protein 4
MEKIKAECRKKSEWLNEMLAKANEAPKHQDPVITCEAILKEVDNLKFFANPILNKPKPKPVPVEKKEDSEEAKKEESEKASPAYEEANKETEDMNVD